MVEDKNPFVFYNKSYRVAEEPLYDPDLDPRPEPQTCSKCDRVAEYVYDGDPFCSNHLPERLRKRRRRCGKIIYTGDESGRELTHEEIRGQVSAWHPITCGGCEHLGKCREEKPESSNIHPRSRGFLPCYEEES